MRKIIYRLLLPFLTLLVYSCTKDKSNYDYKALSKVEIRGLSANGYSKIYLQDELHIEPEIISDDASAVYEYLWTVNRDNTSTSTFDYKVDTIGKKKVLDYAVAIKPGVYNLTLRLTNTANQLQVFKTTKLEVSTLFSRAFYLLKDMGSYTELDAHLSNGTVLPDILEKSLNVKLPGKPVSLGMIYQYSYINQKTGANENGNALGICTDQDINIFKTADMTKIYDHNELFFGSVPSEKPRFIYPNLTGLGYISDKGHYRSLQNSGSRASGKFSFPDLVDGKPTSPNLNTIYDFGFFFFDDLNGRFLCVNVNNIVAGYSGNGKPNLPYDIPHKLLFYGRSKIANDSRGYAIFRDKDNPSRHYLYTMTLSSSDLSNPIRDVRIIDPSSKFNQAKYFASNETQARVLYFVSADNKMYMYDIEANTESLMSAEGIDGDEEITYIRQRYWTAPADLANNFNSLIIASYKNGKYKVGFYETLGGKPSGVAKRILKGEGKVTHFQYAAPSMNSFSYPYYTSSY